jgi:hypothetical protein
MLVCRGFDTFLKYLRQIIYPWKSPRFHGFSPEMLQSIDSIAVVALQGGSLQWLLVEIPGNQWLGEPCKLST